MSAAAAVGMAVIGSSGHAARVSAPAIAAAPGARLVGVVGSAPGRGRALAAGHPGCRAYANLDDLCADPEVEAVWIAGPNDRHVEHAAACLAAGKHVLLEKPMATTLAGAERLLELSLNTEPILTVGFQHRFRPGHLWLRDALERGLVGEVGLLRIHRFWPFPYFPGMPSDPAASWRSSLQASGGWALNDIGSHLIDLAQWLIGGPARLTFARTTNLKFREAAAEDTAVLVLDAGAATTLTIETSNAMSSFPGTIEIHGSAGWLRAEGTFDDGGATILTHAGDRHDLPDVTAAEVYDRALVDFLGAIHGQPAMGATARQAADTVAIVEAAVAGHRPAPREMNPSLEIIDSHVHVWRRRHPAGAALWREPYPVERLWETLDAAGVRAAVQVTPSPEGWDNGYGIEAAARHRDRLRVFGRLDPASPDPGGRLSTWLARPGASGVRLTFFARSAAADGGLLALEPFWAACERLGAPVAVFAPDNLVELVRVLERHPRLRLVVDHLGLGVYPGCTDPLGGLRTLPEFAAFQNVRVKISGLPEVSREGFPFRDVHEHLAETVRRFGADRLIWGSNHPVVLSCCTYGESLEYLQDCDFLDQQQLAWLVGGSLRKLLGDTPDGARLL